MSISSLLKSIASKLLKTTVKNSTKNLGRNSPCHCGSGRKYKYCHLRQDEAEERNQERDLQLANMNRNNEPDWDPLLGPAGSIGQKGLSSAKQTMDKLKG